MLDRLKEMAREPSTWRGLGLCLSLAGIGAGPELAQTAGTAVVALIGLWEIVRKQRAA